MSNGDEVSSSSRRTLLICSQALLGAWSEHAAAASNVIAVAHTNVAHALEMIEQAQPQLVVVEQALAGTERGQELMEHLHNERSLRGLDISLLPASGADALLSTGPGEVDPQQWLTGLARPLPPRPVRSATRMAARAEEHVMVDGNRATLLDLSATGAQVRSLVALRPNQHVRVVLSERGSIRSAGVIVWSKLEQGKPLRYRAGVAFTSPIQELAPKPEEGSKKVKKPRARAARKAR
jgi:hypothetical protein